MATSTVTNVAQELAREALELQVQANELAARLDEKKEELRNLANGKKMNIVVEGLGKVDVIEPREGSESVVLVFNEEKLNESPELRAKLIQKGIAKEEVKKQSAARASVRITPNV